MRRRAQRLLKEAEVQAAQSSNNESFTLDMNCDGMTTSDCLNYMQNYLFDHIRVDRSYSKHNIPVKQPYNKLNPPVEGDIYDTVKAGLLVTFHDLIAVDTVSGSVTLSFFVDLYWQDQLLTWNSSNTMDNAELVLPLNMIWVPDFVIYNAVGSSNEELGQAVVFLYSDGYVNFSGKGLVEVACTFDLLHFPFDTQTCSTVFGSWAYPNYQLDFADVDIDIDPDFNNLGWSIDDISSFTKVETYWDVYDYSFAVYDLTISRYSVYYVRTAVLPCLVTSLIVLFGLWVDDIGSRLSLSVTGLLTNIAVQWTVSSELPITSGQVWLSSFLTLTMLFIALVCLQCFASGYMHAQKPGKPVPRWMKVLIDASLLRIPYLTEEALDDEIAEAELLKSKGSASGTGVTEDGIALQTLNPLSENSPEGSGVSALDIVKEKAEEGRPMEGLEGTPEEEMLSTRKLKYTWQRGSRSFDRVCRILVPILFAIFVGVELGTMT
mmetsp:Transcript_28570/g.53153  ORF Transcript_28570/g.53153 Transcript_28570/m.53153 type:complete len:491 (-) Transcript_28570:35-1507(-)